MISQIDIAEDISRRVSRQQAFFSRKTSPGLLVFKGESPATGTARLHERDAAG